MTRDRVFDLEHGRRANAQWDGELAARLYARCRDRPHRRLRCRSPSIPPCAPIRSVTPAVAGRQNASTTLDFAVRGEFATLYSLPSCVEHHRSPSKFKRENSMAPAAPSPDLSVVLPLRCGRRTPLLPSPASIHVMEKASAATSPAVQLNRRKSVSVLGRIGHRRVCAARLSHSLWLLFWGMEEMRSVSRSPFRTCQSASSSA